MNGRMEDRLVGGWVGSPIALCAGGGGEGAGPCRQ